MVRFLLLILLLLPGCYAASGASDASVGDAVLGACVDPVLGNEACAAWNARTSALGCPESETWPCPWAGPGAVERACLTALEAASSCAEAYEVPRACEVCR